MTETVNFHIEDSKTKYSRDMTYVGVTGGQLALKGAENLRHLWSLSGFETTTTRVDGMWVQRPNYFVLRLSLLGMEREGRQGLDSLIRLVRNSDEHFLRKSRSWIINYLNERYKGETGSEEIRYVNVAGGPRGSGDITRARAWLVANGYGEFVERGEVPGPLLRATARGSPHVITHMPLKPGSSYAHVPRALAEGRRPMRSTGPREWWMPS